MRRGEGPAITRIDDPGTRAARLDELLAGQRTRRRGLAQQSRTTPVERSHAPVVGRIARAPGSQLGVEGGQVRRRERRIPALERADGGEPADVDAPATQNDPAPCVG